MQSGAYLRNGRWSPWVYKAERAAWGTGDGARKGHCVAKSGIVITTRNTVTLTSSLH